MRDILLWQQQMVLASAMDTIICSDTILVASFYEVTIINKFFGMNLFGFAVFFWPVAVIATLLIYS